MTLREILRSAFGRPQDLPNAVAPSRGSATASPAVALRDSKPNEMEFRQALAAAFEGDVDARRKVGILYYRGFGVRPNPPQAMKWLSLAAEQGDAKADEFLGLMQQAMTPEEIATAQRLLARFKGQPEPDFSDDDKSFESPEEQEERQLHAEAGERWIPNDEFADERELLTDGANGRPVGAEAAMTRSPAMPRTAAVPESAPARGPALVQVIVWVTVVLVAMGAVGAGIFWLVNHPIEEVTIETQKPAEPAVTMSMPMPRPPEPMPPVENRSSAPTAAATSPAANPPTTGTAAQPQTAPATTPGNAEVQRLFAEARAGNRQAQFLAGLALAEGKLMPANLPEALQWFTIAAERGHPDAQNNLAIFYIRGMGVPKDLVAAYKWIALARAGGNRDAAANEERLRQMLQPDELARAQQQVAGFIPKP